jgi:8-oxo-dGTP diphosphatase
MPGQAQNLCPPHVQLVVAGFWWKGDALFLVKRWPSAVSEWSEAWGLPGGKVESGEDPKTALRREWREELSAEVSIGALLCAYAYRVQGYAKPVKIAIYRVEGATPPVLTPAGGQEMAWVPLNQLAGRKLLPSTNAALASFEAEHE